MNSRSPFAAYQYAAVQQAPFTGPRPETTAAAMLAAAARGDRRASAMYDQFVRAHPGMDTSLIKMEAEGAY